MIFECYSHPVATTRKGAKRANGEGSISYDPDRKRYDVRLTINGKRRQVSAPTQAEAWRRAKELKAADGVVSGLGSRPTVGAWLSHWRTNVLPSSKRARSTIDSYAWWVDKYLIPELGRHKLVDLTPAHVEQFLRRLEGANSVSGRPLGASSRQRGKAVLQAALKSAQKQGLVSRNVAALADGPGLEPPRGRSLTPDEARTVVAAIQSCGDPLTEALLTLLLRTGMRKGEALGLRWGDVDLDLQTITVRRVLARAPKVEGRGTLYLVESTKSGSDRVIDITSQTVAALRRWKTEQAAQRLACPPFLAGLRWGFTFPDDLVFTGSRGEPLDLARPNAILDSITKPLGLGHWTVHSLRHTSASLSLGAGVPLPVVSQILGHSSIGITHRVYGHLVSGEKKAAAEALEGVLTGGRTQTS
jgi:integrase